MQETPFQFQVGKVPWRRDRLPTPVFLGFHYSSAGKESTCNAGELGSIPWLGRSPGEGKGYQFQYSGLENSTDYTVHGVAKSQSSHDWETFTPCGNFPSRIVIFLDPSPRLLVQVPLSVFFSFPKTQIQTEIQSVQGEFTKLRQILDSEEAKELRKLKDELGVILKELAESENDLVQEKLLVSSHISDVERRLQGSTMELLQVRLQRNPSLWGRREICSCDPSDALVEAALTLQYTFSASISEVVRIPELFNVGIIREALFLLSSSSLQTLHCPEQIYCSVTFINPCFLWPSAEHLSRTFSWFRLSQTKSLQLPRSFFPSMCWDSLPFFCFFKTVYEELLFIFKYSI